LGSTIGYFIYLVCFDIDGNVLWTKTYGQDGGNEYGYSVSQTIDGGYIITGNTSSFGAGSYDVYLVKTTSDGTLSWTKTFGGSSQDYGKQVLQTADNGFLVVGYTKSFGAGSADIYLIKTDVNGTYVWSKTYGGTVWDVGYSVDQTLDGGFVIGGLSSSYGSGGYDAVMIITDNTGNLQWAKAYGGTAD
jgi:hypothetical protein